MQDLNINIGSLSTTGYDVNIGYTGVEIGRFGSLSFNLTGTYLVDLITQPAPGIDLHPSPDVRATGTTASASTRRSAAFPTRSGGTASGRAGRRRGTSTCRSPGATTAA